MSFSLSQVANFLFLSFRHIVHITILATAEKVNDFQFFLTLCNKIIGEAWLVILGVYLGTFLVVFFFFFFFFFFFALYFCTEVMNMVNDQYAPFKCHVLVILYFFVLPKASYV